MTEPKQTAESYISKKIDTTSIYPTAKTLEERLKGDKNREQMMFSRQPRHLALSTATRLFIVIFLGMMLFKLAPAIVAWNVLSGAFNVVLGALALLLIVKWQTSIISTAMDKKGVNDSSFFGLYLAVLVAPMVIACHYINRQNDVMVLIALYAGLFLIHYLAIQLLIRMLLKRS